MVFRSQAHGGHLGLVRIAHLPLSAVGGTAAAATATVVVLAVVPHAHPRAAARTGGDRGAASGATPTAAASGPTPGAALAGRLSAVGASASRALAGPTGDVADRRTGNGGQPAGGRHDVGAAKRDRRRPARRRPAALRRPPARPRRS